MTKKNSKNLYAWGMFVNRVKKRIRLIRKPFLAFDAKYPNITQAIQLTFIYSFAMVDLCYGVLSNVFSYGSIPELILPVYPLVSWVLQSPILKIWASPEKVFFLSYVVIEFMIVRSVLKFSKLVKYNVLLIFALLMIQGLAISYWDLLFNREIINIQSRLTLDQASFLITDANLALTFFYNTFFIFTIVYFYLYLTALTGKFATIPGVEWLTDSVAFWLRIKTPSMRFGKRKKKKDTETDS